MLKQYKGRLLSSVEPITSISSGSGMWALEEYMQGQAAGTWPIPPQFVEDIFSTYLYTGAPSGQTITNGIDLSGQGGLVWIKGRTTLAGGSPTLHLLTDTNRGAGYTLQSHLTAPQFLNSSIISSFTSSGFSIGTEGHANQNGTTFASWTFRKAPKFFDIVTYTGNASVRTIAHNLGVAPGMIIIKPIGEANIWVVYHRSIGATKYIVLNATQGENTWTPYFNNTEPTASVFTLGNDNSEVNKTGTQYVAYLFAHDALADGIIQCGSVTDTTSTTATVNLGWEPQWIMLKKTTTGGGNATINDDWMVADNMRGLGANATSTLLYPNLSGSEGSQGFSPISINSTGFNVNGAIDQTDTFIYVAIRRGPMRTPTVGTSVFSPAATSADTATTGFPVDLIVQQPRTISSVGAFWADRLRGAAPGLNSSNTNAETSWFTSTWSQNNVGVTNTGMGYGSSALWSFRRAPGFMDVVCYAGPGASPSIEPIAHNLGVVPELIILKCRNAVSGWTTNIPGAAANGILYLQTASGAYFGGLNWGRTATTFTPAGDTGAYLTGNTYVAYLFASAPGVSKVGSYTGNGSSQTINCAFTTGARFVLIKRTDTTGDWYVWDSARGIVADNDPYLALNTTVVEVTSNDSVDTDNTGFVVNQVGASNINVTSATYIFLAIA